MDENKELKTVCGLEIIDPADHPKAEYKGETVYFCGQGCLRAFNADPDGYIESSKPKDE